MAIVLEVSLTLNPGNQIAYLADDTGLIVGTEYVVAGTHLAADTRFTFNGNLDIVLTKQPIAVPTNNYVTPVSINTVPQAAPAPPPATYPYSVKNQLTAGGLNHDMEFSPGAVPPQSALGGAGKFKYWIDTSTTIPSLRQCVVARASTTYVAADWILLGTVDAAAHKFHFNGDVVDFVGGGGTSNIFNVTNITVTGATTLNTLNVTGGSTLNTLNVTGASTLATLNVTGAARLPTITGPTTVTGGMTVSGGIHYTGVVGGNAISFGWDGNVHNYVDGTDVGSTVMRITAGNGLSGGGGPSGGTVTLQMSGSYSGNLGVTGTVTAAQLTSTGSANVAGTVTAAQLTSTGNINATGNIGAVGAYLTLVSASGNVDAGGRVYAGGNVQTPVVNGGYGSSGTLQMWNTGNRVCFKWDGGVSNGGAASYRVDEAVEKYMCTTANVFDLQYAYPGGGPTNAVMGGHDVPGTWYYSFIDYIGSDERIKGNIGPSEVDALGVLRSVPVSKFDVKGPVAAWFRNMGMETDKRIASMRDATPVHVPIGFVAQRIQPHLPEAVCVGRQDGAIPEAPLPVDMLNINRQEFIPYLVRAVQQLLARLEVLERA